MEIKQHYYVNMDDTHNPNLHHEVHTEEHANTLGIKNKKYLGYFSNCKFAVEKAKGFYSDADGCSTCCKECNTDR